MSRIQTTAWKITFIAALSSALMSCTYPDPQEEVSFGAFLPKPEQMTLTPSMIPAPLSLLHALPQPSDEEAEQNLVANGATRNNISLASFRDSRVSMNHDRVPSPGDPSVTDLQLTDLFDPFYVGSANTDENRTDANCAATRDGEPDGLMRFSNSWCVMGVIKIALHRAVTLYDNFHYTLVAIIQNLADDNNPKGVVLQYTNTSVQTLHSDGVTVSIFYDDCGTTLDPSAQLYCQSENSNVVYHRATVRPLHPTSTFVNTDSIIGKMEWLVYPDTSVKGKMAIASSLMTPATFTSYAPPQMQFEFNSDSTGRFQSFVIKFAPQLPPGGAVSRELAWAANVIRVTREPGTGGSPGIWAVEGSIQYALDLGFNPIGPFTYSPFSGRDGRVYFVAVAEDVFAKGLTVYKAILADNGGGGSLDYHTYTSPTDPVVGWDKQLNLWASYKKMLKNFYTPNYYLVGLGMDGAPVRIWNADSARQIFVGGKDAGAPVVSLDYARDGSSRIVLATSSKDTIPAQLQIWTRELDPYGGATLRKVGSCQPFSANATLSNAVFNPVNSNQVLVGDGTNGGTFEARIFDISAVSGNSGACPIVHSYYHQPDTTYPARNILKVNFSPDGTKILTVNVWFDFVWVWDVTNTTTPVLKTSPTNYSLYTAQFDSSSTRVVLSAADNSTYVVNIATGKKLRLYNDEGPVAATALQQYVAASIPSQPNQIISSRVGGYVSHSFDSTCSCWPPDTRYPAQLYRWDISSWNPLSDATWITSSSPPGLVQTVNVSDSRGYDVMSLYVGAMSPNGAKFALNSWNTTVIYDLLADGTIVSPPAFSTTTTGLLNSPAFAPESNTLFEVNNINYNSCYGCASEVRGATLMWDLTKPFTRPYRGGHLGQGTMATFISDQNVLSAGVDGNAIIWNAFDGSVDKIFSGHTGSVTKAIITHNGTRLVTGSLDGTVRWWDATYSSPTFGNTLVTIPARLDINSAPIGINSIAYDNHFGTNRIAVVANDGQVDLYDETGTLLKTFPGLLPNGAKWASFSHDGTLLIVAGNGATNHVAVISSDPGIPYGVNGPYNNLGTLTLHTSNVNSAEFYPNDKTRILTSSTSEGNSKVHTLTITPNTVDPINNPPTASATLEVTLGHGGRMARAQIIGTQIQALVTDGLSSGSGCYGCPRITHWDITPGTPNYGKRFSLSDPSGVTAPYGQPEYYDETASQIQNRGVIYSGEFSPAGDLVIGAGDGSLYQPSWVDFDSFFNQTDSNGVRVRPDERDNVNPYFVEHVITASADACFNWDAVNRICTQTCAELAADLAIKNPLADPRTLGCATYKVTSQRTFDINNVKPNPPAAFRNLYNRLLQFSIDNPSTAGYYLDSFVYQPLN